jgi:histidine triad (HIT) family protein
MSDCIFCKIAAGTIPSTKVEESANVYAFRDIQPQAPTHVLLIPKKHLVASAADIGSEHGAVLAEVFALAARIARSERLQGGWRLVTNVGPDAGQSVLHLHFHLLGGRAMQWPPG